MSVTRDIQAGDWVRFYSAGRLVVGAVQYVQRETRFPYTLMAMTDVGSVDVDYVLEARRDAVALPRSE